MRVTINGEERNCEATDLADLWRKETADLDIAEPRGFAISLNGAVVRRDNWITTAVRDGDAIEIVRGVRRVIASPADARPTQGETT